ncbi:hypothetical protein EVA_17083 [gut metagenome]|uniref:Uncharacterized protein n=1 Tax=gut metagenome TaxID=749906 RepID=J9FZ30_9ZZZZ
MVKLVEEERTNGWVEYVGVIALEVAGLLFQIFKFKACNARARII